jgi:hypothetical protein
MKHIQSFDEFKNELLEAVQEKYFLKSTFKPGELKQGVNFSKNTKRYDFNFVLQIDENTIHQQYFSVGIKNGELSIKPGAITTNLWRKDEDGIYQTIPQKKTTSQGAMQDMIEQIKIMFE